MTGETTATERVGERYVLGDRIAEDATGALLRAHDERLDREVFVRMVKRASSPELRRTFVREARILGALSHEALPTVYEVRVDDDPAYVVLEATEGHTLATVLATGERQPLAAVLRVAIRLLGAVQAAHENGFVLREIPPESVLLVDGPDGPMPKLMALGAARRQRGTEATYESPRTGAWAALPESVPPTAAYGVEHTAPEVLTGASVDPRSDIYAVGALAYHLLLGRPPLAAGEGEDARVTAPRDLDPTLPSRLESALLRALEARPEDRFRSAEKMAVLLARIASGGPGRKERQLRKTTSAVPVIGDTIGEYRVRAELGSGGMGTVLLARDEVLERDVAIKVLRSLDERERERLRAEARTMAKVDHPNVVRVFTLGEHAGAPYLVMEHVPGTTVEKRIESAPQGLSVDEALAIADQTARGLEAVHEAGLLHGDVKPSNVLIGPAFRVGVMDFGLARALGSFQGDESRVAGTPAYCPPERIHGRIVPELAPRADLYSLAVMTFEMLTGRLPFLEDDPIRMLRKHVGEAPPAPSAIRGDLPPTLDAPILRALSKRPLERQPSVQAFREELARARETLRRRTPRRLLVVDDDSDFRVLLGYYLERLYPGAGVVAVGSVADAMGALRGTTTYDAVLLDLDLPDGNAVELAARVRAELAEPPPLLVVTGTGTAADWQVLAALGVRAFLLKPLDEETLAVHLDRLVTARGT